MKLYFLLVLLLVGLILVSGCTSQNDSVKDSDEKSDSIIGKPIGKKTNQVTDTSPPRIGRFSTSPNNPDIDETVTITVEAEDDRTLKEISWASSKPFANGQEGSFDCNLQKTCSASFELTTLDSGLHEVVITAVDSSGQTSQSTSQITVSTYVAKKTTEIEEEPETASFTCGNSICEGGESYLNCEQDCEASKTIGTSPADGACEPGESIENAPKDCTNPNPKCGNGVCDSDETRMTCYADCEEDQEEGTGDCSTNSDCGYKQICRSGKCESVQCTNDAQCTGCRRCSDYTCRSCGYGPAGYCSC